MNEGPLLALLLIGEPGANERRVLLVEMEDEIVQQSGSKGTAVHPLKGLGCE